MTQAMPCISSQQAGGIIFTAQNVNIITVNDEEEDNNIENGSKQ